MAYYNRKREYKNKNIVRERHPIFYIYRGYKYTWRKSKEIFKKDEQGRYNQTTIRSAHLFIKTRKSSSTITYNGDLIEKTSFISPKGTTYTYIYEYKTGVKLNEK